MSERLMVAVRVRPFLPHESLASCVAVQANQLCIGETKGFAFDRVFDMDATSDDVYVALGQPLADAFLSGYHASTIAYGQTGAGKTFTMDALLCDTVQEIFCRLAEDGESEEAMKQHSSAADAPTHSPPFTMSLTVVEVYNEAVGDLLSRQGGLPFATAGGGGSVQRGGGAFAPEKRESGSGGGASAQQQQRNALQLREDPSGGVYVVGLTEVNVDSEARLLALIEDAIGNRKTASTLMNATSSRSHCVVTLTLRRRGLCSRCCFVDLAGSERLKKSLGLGTASDRTNANSVNGSGDANGSSPMDAALRPANAVVRMREGININGGLLALGNVIVALCERKSHIPYRSSKLTRLLQPMLEGHSRTAMIACVAPLASSLEETLNTLKYADRAKRIQLNPHLALAVPSTPADTQQLIAMLREQLEDAQRRLSAAGSRPQNGVGRTRSRSRRRSGSVTRGGAGDKPVSTSTSTPQQQQQQCALADLEEAQRLLVRERAVTQRLEGDLFTAEYTAMIEVERRKALESRVAELEAHLRATRGSARTADGADQDALHAADAADGDGDGVDGAPPQPPSPRARLTMNMARLQQLEEERASLAAVRERRVCDAQRLEAAVAAGEEEGREKRSSSDTYANNNSDGAEGDRPFSSPTTAAAAAAAECAGSGVEHLTVGQLTEEIQQKESQIAQLRRENETVSAQLQHYERELHGTLTEKARLQAELRRAEAQLEKSAMERDHKESEKATLRATYLERIRRAEVRATDYRRRVKEAEQEVHTRQENIDRTRQLQETIVQLREELTRQRLEVRTTKRQSDQRAAAHQQEALNLQRQLQQSTAQVTQLQQRLARKDATIAKAKKQLAEQQPQPPPQQQPSQPQVNEPAASASPPLPLPAAPVAFHKMPSNMQPSPCRVSVKQPPSATASPNNVSFSVDTPPSGTSPPRITKRRVTLTNHQRSDDSSGHHGDARGDALHSAQALIDRELKELERLEKELAELHEYRAVLLSAQSTDAPKWHRAREGFTRRLTAIQSELAAMEKETPTYATLAQEERGVKAKLQQLQTYRHMFEDADEQLAEFDNRIENLNTARRFHLQRVRRLQQSSAQRRRNSVGGRSGSVVAGKETAGDGDDVPLPSVRDITATRLACAVRSLSHDSLVRAATPPRSPLGPAAAAAGVGRDSERSSSTYTAALEEEVARLMEETRTLQSRRKAA